MDPHLSPINTLQGGIDGDVNDILTSSKGNKRLFSHSFSKYSSREDDTSNDGSCTDEQSFDDDSPFEKRYRTSDWPLDGNGGSIEGDATALGADGPASPYGRSDEPAPQRSRRSKFKEGSMNNRVSHKPPRTYIAARDELSHPGDNEGNKKLQRSKLNRHSKQSVPGLQGPGESKTGTNRQSTIFRFGKSLAASFNPSNWKIWSKAQDAEVSNTQTNTDALAKLEKAYKEVKSVPFTPGLRPGVVGKTGVSTSAKLQNSPTNSSRTNVIVVDNDSEQSKAQKRYGVVFVDPPFAEAVSHQDSSTPQHISRHSAPVDMSAIPPNQQTHSNESRSSFTYGSPAPLHPLKNIPSRQELRAQRKLVKRVSDLEMKLEAARLKLNKSMGNTFSPQPIQSERYRFVPGALASLPSESLLNGYTEQNEYSTVFSSAEYIGTALTTDEKISLAVVQSPEETRGRHSTSDIGNACDLSAPANSNRELTVVTDREGGDTKPQSGNPVDFHEGDKIGVQAARDVANANGLEALPSKKRKGMGKGCATGEGSHGTSLHPEDQDDIPKPSQGNPAKKARNHPKNHSRAESIVDANYSNAAVESGDPENHDESAPQPSSVEPLSVKSQGNSKLIVKKRGPPETQGSRIPRKGSRKETPPSSVFADENTNPLGGVEAATQPVGRLSSKEVAASGSLPPRRSTRSETGKLRKAAKTSEVRSSLEVDKQVGLNEKRKSNGNAGAANNKKMGSSDSFEWGSDVF